jgi:hypothetical protein
LVLLFVLTGALFARDRIADIEFFGYKGVDVEAVRKALPVAPGTPNTEGTKGAVREAVRRATGRDATDVAFVCCDAQGESRVNPAGSSRFIENQHRRFRTPRN